MRLRFEHSRLGSACALLLLAGCSGGSVLEPDRDSSLEGGIPLAVVASVEEVCATIDFESLAHGDLVSSVSVPELRQSERVAVDPSGLMPSSGRISSSPLRHPPSL